MVESPGEPTARHVSLALPDKRETRPRRPSRIWPIALQSAHICRYSGDRSAQIWYPGLRESSVVAQALWLACGVTRWCGRWRHSGVPMVVEKLEAVYREHAAELIRFATALVGPDDASNVVTETMVRVFDESVDVAGIVNLRAFLFKSVYRQAIDLQRSRSRRTRPERRYTDRSTGSVPRDETAAVAARTALSRLSEQQRGVVFLTYWLGLSPSEIAVELGVSEGTVRKQLARARARLREELR